MLCSSIPSRTCTWTPHRQSTVSALHRPTAICCLGKQAHTAFGTSQPAQDILNQHLEPSSCAVSPACESQLHSSNPQASTLLFDAPFASLSRVLLVGQPSNLFRNLAARRWPAAMGPVSLLLFLLGTVLAIVAAVRGALVKKVKGCKSCRGYGVVRCRLCEGRGAVDWKAKFMYSEMCPLCVAKRFVECPDCGGHYHRPLFSHMKIGGPAKVNESFAAMAVTGVTRPLD